MGTGPEGATPAARGSTRLMLLAAMQSLVHGNFSGDDQRKAYALVGAAAAVAAAIGPLLGGFVATSRTRGRARSTWSARSCP